tara:strand:+ start:2027 stop:2563 length:537 start_codon:yes stop_codon:yes gene_type:complete
MKKTIISLLTATALVGCASTTTPKYAQTYSPFNLDDVAWIKEKGEATITGQAFLRTRGGDVKTCAGSTVYLIPSSNYAVERIRLLYGEEDNGVSWDHKTAAGEVLPVADPLYFEYTLQTYCDADGNFKFENLPDGIYYLGTSVRWETGAKHNSLQGGSLMQRAVVSDGVSESRYIMAH